MAKGAVISLVGTTFSVVGEALDFFARKYGDRPSCAYLIPTAQTEPYAQLAKLAIVDKFSSQPPIARIRPAPIYDIHSERDFISLVEHISAVFRDAYERCGMPILASITGGRKTMSLAGAIVFSHLGADVVDTRSATAEEDKAAYSQIAHMLADGMDPKDIYESLAPVVRDLTFRSADTAYVLPRFRLDLGGTDGRIVSAVGWLSGEEGI